MLYLHLSYTKQVLVIFQKCIDNEEQCLGNFSKRKIKINLMYIL